MMDYRKVKLNDFELEVEVGVIPGNITSSFLSALKVRSSTLSKEDYEEFLLSNLIKDFKQLVAYAKTITDETERKTVRRLLLENIYRVNTKLNPQALVIYNNQILPRMESIKKGGPSEPVLTMNPGWRDFSSGAVNLDTTSVKNVLDDIWEDVKANSPHDYLLTHINVLDMEIPILNVASLDFNIDAFIQNFLEKKCEGNVFLARHDNRPWIGYVLAFAIPRVEEFIYHLLQANYIATYTENVIYTQMYLAVIKVNPVLNYDLIDWDYFEKPEKNNTRSHREVKPSERTPVKGGVRSSKAEAEADKPKFMDVPYERVLGLGEELKKHIIGQDKIVDSVCESIAVARVGLRGPKKPIGTFLFTGKTGVGKTELSKVLATCLTGREPIRIDCSEYQQAHEISKIFGAPPGYVGFEDEGRHPHQGAPPTTVASKLKANPFSVVLFDEIEKADPAIDNVLLQIMDEGHVTSGRGETISFKDALIVLTSNVGSAEAEEICLANKLGFGEDARDKCSLSENAINEAIKERFKPEFRNRLSEIVIFNGLDKDVCKGIVDVLLKKTKENLEQAQQLSLSWDDAVREVVLDEGFSEEFGAREIERTIHKKIELPLAKHILTSNYITGNSTQLKKGSILDLTIVDGELSIKHKDNDNGKKNNTGTDGVPDQPDSNRWLSTPSNNKA